MLNSYFNGEYLEMDNKLNYGLDLFNNELDNNLIKKIQFSFTIKEVISLGILSVQRWKVVNFIIINTTNYLEIIIMLSQNIKGVISLN